MPNQTFPCPFCGKKMGVGVELLGKKVRCPHCNQILVAPSSVVPAAPPRVDTPPNLPTFNLPTQEARESIFGDHQDEGDDVLDSSGGTKLQVPELPPIEPPLSPSPRPPTVQTPREFAPTTQMETPFSGFDPPA